MNGTAESLITDADNVRGVRLTDGSKIEGDCVVLAMGPWSNMAGEWLGYDVPVIPQKGELLYMHLPADEARDIEQDRPPATMHNMDDGGVILTRRLSRTVLGATKEDGKGYDREPSDYAWEFILPRVQRLTNRISKDSVTHHTACLRPMPARRKALRRTSTSMAERLHRVWSLVRGCSLCTLNRQSNRRPHNHRNNNDQHQRNITIAAFELRGCMFPPSRSARGLGDAKPSPLNIKGEGWRFWDLWANLLRRWRLCLRIRR